MRLISPSSRPLELDDDGLLLAGGPVLGATWRMPLASMSKVTSICGTPRGAGGMPASWKRPACGCRRHLALALQHVMSTAGWWSAAVEKTSLLLVGMVVFRESARSSPRRASPRPAQRVTSSSTISLASPVSTAPGSPRRPPHLVGVDPLLGSLRRSPGPRSPRGHAGHAPDQHHSLMSEARGPRLERLPAGTDHSPVQAVDQLFELGAAELHPDVLGRTCRRDERQVDLGARRAGQSHLAFSAASLRRCRPLGP